MPAALDIRGLTVQYASGGYVVRPIDAFDLQVSSGELVLLLGASGSGKTTLLSVLAGILTPTAGTIRFGDLDVTSLRGAALTDYRRHTVGIVFQTFNLVPSLTALENVQAPLWAAKIKAEPTRARARQLIEQVGLADRAGHRPGDLSGGQQQRVAIARALAHDPTLLLADEPTAHLDYIQVESILRVLRELASPGRVVIVATHDERLLPLADRVVEMTPRAPSDAQLVEHLVFEPGQTVFEQGDRSDLVYVIEDGEVEIVRVRADSTEERLASLGAGQYFGELGPLFGLRRSATARAVTRASVTGYPVGEFRSLIAPHGITHIVRTAAH
jgi:putative ABC transport system ATP-binding protein